MTLKTVFVTLVSQMLKIRMLNVEKRKRIRPSRKIATENRKIAASKVTIKTRQNHETKPILQNNKFVKVSNRHVIRTGKQTGACLQMEARWCWIHSQLTWGRVPLRQQLLCHSALLIHLCINNAILHDSIYSNAISITYADSSGISLYVVFDVTL